MSDLSTRFDALRAAERVEPADLDCLCDLCDLWADLGAERGA
jgi:hypothetical protein